MVFPMSHPPRPKRNEYRKTLPRWAWSLPAILAACAVVEAAPKPPATKPPPAPPKPKAEAPAPQSEATGSFLITSRSVGPVRIGMKLSEAQRLLPGVVLQRQFDGEGLPWVALIRNDEVLLSVLADDPGAKRKGHATPEDAADPRYFTEENRIDETQSIDVIQVFHPSFRTAQGVGPETPLPEVEQKYGKLRRIEWSAVEQREYAFFERQPKHLFFRVDGGTAGEAGLYKKKRGATAVTRRYAPTARILGVMVGQ
jgi:hypothetical protein